MAHVVPADLTITPVAGGVVSIRRGQPVRVDAQRTARSERTRTLHQLLLCAGDEKRPPRACAPLIFASSFAVGHAPRGGCRCDRRCHTARWDRPPAAVGFAPPGPPSFQCRHTVNKRNRGWRTPSCTGPGIVWSFPSGTSHILRAPACQRPTTRDRWTYWSNPRLLRRAARCWNSHKKAHR